MAVTKQNKATRATAKRLRDAHGRFMSAPGATTKRREPAPYVPESFAAALRELEAEGMLTIGAEWRPGVYTYYPRTDKGRPISPAILAKNLAPSLTGVVMVGSAGVTWRHGSYTGGRLMEAGRVCDVIDARERYAYITGDAAPDNLVSVGGIARALMHWVTPPIRERRDPERGFERLYGVNETLVFQFAAPGQYMDMRLFDIKACYFTLLSRLRSLRPCFNESLPLFVPDTVPVAERWRALLDGVADCKPLRNILFGVCLGGSSTSPLLGFKRDKLNPGRAISFKAPPGFGHARGAALLVAATAKELCRAACKESAAVYANTDCVITPQHTPPAIWTNYDLTVRLDGSGDADIRALGVYKVGHRDTLRYRALMKQEEERQARAASRGVSTGSVLYATAGGSTRYVGKSADKPDWLLTWCEPGAVRKRNVTTAALRHSSPLSSSS